MIIINWNYDATSMQIDLLLFDWLTFYLDSSFNRSSC